MDWLSSVLGILKGWFGLQSAQQERLNAPDIVANADAARDVKEQEKITKDIQQGTKTEDLTEERKDFSDDA